MSESRTRNQSASKTSTSTTKPTTPAAAPNASDTSRKPTSSERRDRLMKEWRCFHCEGKGHLAQSCPFRTEQAPGAKELKALRPTKDPEEEGKGNP